MPDTKKIFRFIELITRALEMIKRLPKQNFTNPVSVEESNYKYTELNYRSVFIIVTHYPFPLRHWPDSSNYQRHCIIRSDRCNSVIFLLFTKLFLNYRYHNALRGI